jgi:hypothetical protein
VLAISIGFLVPNAAAQPDPYLKMAPVDQCLMEENAEIQLARSAAPDSISRDATILVLGGQGYETAVEGKNRFVCMVGRGWTGMFDWPEFWSPKVNAAACMSRQAARSAHRPASGFDLWQHFRGSPAADMNEVMKASEQQRRQAVAH